MPEHELFISTVTIAEIQAGIEITREQDTAKADEIEKWLDLVKLQCAIYVRVGVSNIGKVGALCLR